MIGSIDEITTREIEAEVFGLELEFMDFYAIDDGHGCPSLSLLRYPIYPTRRFIIMRFGLAMYGRHFSTFRGLVLVPTVTKGCIVELAIPIRLQIWEG